MVRGLLQSQGRDRVVKERQRRHHRRSRGGCGPCKQRHVRCDETRPYCSKCLTTGSECKYSTQLGALPGRYTGHAELEQEQDLSLAQIKLVQVGPSNTDPFSSLGVDMPFNSVMLLHHFNNYRVLVTPAAPRKAGGMLLQCAFNDSVSLHSSIMMAANGWVIVGGLWDQVSAAFYYHKVETIRLINSQLSDLGGAASDSIVAAIARLVIVESSLGFIDEAVCHMNGLVQLINIRADLGYSGIPAHPLLHRVVLLADLTLSTKAKMTTRLTLSATEKDLKSQPADQDSLNHFLNNYMSIYPDLENFNSHNNENKKLLALLRHLSGMSYHRTRRTLPPGILLVEIEGLIMSIMHSNGPGDIAAMPSAFTKSAVGIAGNIYLHLFIKLVEVGKPVYSWMLELLKDGLRELKMNSRAIAEQSWPDLWLWIFFVGGCATLRGGDDRMLLCKQLVRLKQMCGIRNWDDVRLVLGRVVWVEDDHGLGLQLWEDVCQVALV